MRQILLKSNRFFYQQKVKYKKQGNFIWYFFELSRRISQILFNAYLKIYKALDLYPHRLNGNSEIVISLTSFPKRIDVVWGAIDSMFHQDIQPGKICLYLSKEEFPNERVGLPNRLLNYEKLGLEICFRPYNLMPHTKYYYALQEHTDKCVITIDDDVYYQSDIIKNLWNLHLTNPEAVCANKANMIKLNEFGEFSPYREWGVATDGKSHSRLALGVAGVLYPPHRYEGNGMFDIDNIKRLSLKADDLWLKIHEIRNDIMVVNNDYCFNGLTLDNSNFVSLNASNVGSGQNDIQWKALSDYYDVNTEIFK